jgi:hypothetical protein
MAFCSCLTFSRWPLLQAKPLLKMASSGTASAVIALSLRFLRCLRFFCLARSCANFLLM